jgi:hypothetical protein
MKTNTMILGPVGTGKSTSLKTLLDCGKEVFLLATEPGVETIFADTDPERFHWHYIPPANPDWDVMIRAARNINTMPLDALLKSTGSRSEYQQFVEVLECCANFKCDRTEKSYGSVDMWGDDKVFGIDSLSGISVMAMDLVAGNKPAKSMSDWGIAMDNLERFITKCCCDTKCSFVLTGHVDREVDEVTGGTKIMASTLGRKLAPKLPRFFDEVVFATRQGNKFYWSTTEMGVDLKMRRLPIRDEMPPTFKLIFGDE